MYSEVQKSECASGNISILHSFLIEYKNYINFISNNNEWKLESYINIILY